VGDTPRRAYLLLKERFRRVGYNPCMPETATPVVSEQEQVATLKRLRGEQ
jgi:hypothetical protein